MNTAARFVHSQLHRNHQSSSSSERVGVASRPSHPFTLPPLILTAVMTKRHTVMLLLSLTLLFSALSIIYVTHMTRLTYTDYQHLMTEQDRLHVMRTQLLLERSALMAPARVEKLAKDKLNMIAPDDTSVVIIRA